MPPEVPGLFVTIEGGEGAGKSTLLAALAERAERSGLRVVRCREPGGTDLGERVRAWLLDGAAAPSPRAELLAFAAARAELVSEVIRPALAEGALVLCDRFTDSTIAYQHHGRGIARPAVDAANAVATGGLRPVHTLLLDLPPEVGLRRAGAGGGDRIEREPLAFHERVRAGFLELAAAEPERWLVLDATRPPAELAERAWRRFAALSPR